MLPFVDAGNLFPLHQGLRGKGALQVRRRRRDDFLAERHKGHDRLRRSWRGPM